MQVVEAFSTMIAAGGQWPCAIKVFDQALATARSADNSVCHSPLVSTAACSDLLFVLCAQLLTTVPYRMIVGVALAGSDCKQAVLCWSHC